MSRVNNKQLSNKQVSNKQVSNKPYCGACHKSGKTMEQYTSHWTRSNPGTDGVVTCPFILASECGYCHEMGHWTKFCPMLANKTDSKPYVSLVEKQVKKAATKVAVVVAPKKKFDMLYMSDDEDEDEAAVKKSKSKESDQRFPALTLKTKINLSLEVPKTTKTWSSVVQTPFKVLCAPMPTTATAPMVKPSNLSFPKMKKVINWADDDSDSDDEEFYTEFVPTGLYA
jgi:hypothetical protein